MKDRIRNIPILGPIARTFQRIVGNSDWLDVITKQVDTLDRRVGPLEGQTKDILAGLNSLFDRVDQIAAHIPGSSASADGLSKSLLVLADMSTAWSGNYTKPVDEAYIQDNQHNHQALFTLVEELGRRVAPHRIPRLLEVGMGLGTMCIAFSRHNFEVTGIDQDALQVARAKYLCRKLGGFARYLCMDIADLGLLQSDSFDVAFSQGTMEHFSATELERALLNQLHVAPYAVFSAPSVEWPHPEVGDERRMTTEEWCLAIEAIGLKPIALEYYGDGRSHVLVAVGRPSNQVIESE